MSHYQQFEPPFEIPDNWEWVRLGDISNYGECTTVLVSNILENEWILELEDIEKDSAVILQTLRKKDRDIKGVRHQFNKNEILYSKLRTYLNKVLVAPKNGYCTTEIIPFKVFGKISPYYINTVLRSQYFLNYTLQCGYGMKMPRLSTTDACNGLIPLPSEKEQLRIGATIQKWFKVIDQIEKDQSKLQTYIQNIKSKILEVAMQGKLVPQDPTDEPAAEMLKRINPKAKIITDNQHSRNVPQGWCFTDLKSIGKWQSGATPSKLNSNYYGKGYPWLNTGDLNDGIIEFVPKEITALALQETPVKLNPVGSVLIAMYGATIGKLGILSFPSTTNQACCSCANCYIFNKFLFFFLLSYRDNFIKLGGGGAQPNISKEKIENTILLLPPLEEQKRIVAKIEELYSVLDKIEASLQS
ncbi:MAG: restriction endonuclease subunit S [Bacteroidales bacterium]|nr:restriction endonuclease subunit S [Bacteroidales bacterium]